MPGSSTSGPEHAAPGPRELPLMDAQRMTLPSKLEAWTLTSQPAPARFVAVADNRLYIANIQPVGTALQEVLSGVARGDFRRPTVSLALAEAGCDLVAVGVAKGILLWRVP